MLLLLTFNANVLLHNFVKQPLKRHGGHFLHDMAVSTSVLLKGPWQMNPQCSDRGKGNDFTDHYANLLSLLWVWLCWLRSSSIYRLIQKTCGEIWVKNSSVSASSISVRGWNHQKCLILHNWVFKAGVTTTASAQQPNHKPSMLWPGARFTVWPRDHYYTHNVMNKVHFIWWTNNH